MSYQKKLAYLDATVNSPKAEQKVTTQIQRLQSARLNVHSTSLEAFHLPNRFKKDDIEAGQPDWFPERRKKSAVSRETASSNNSTSSSLVLPGTPDDTEEESSAGIKKLGHSNRRHSVSSATAKMNKKPTSSNSLNNSLTKPVIVTKPVKIVAPGKKSKGVTAPPANNSTGLNGSGGKNRLAPNGITPRPSRSTTPRMKDPKEGKVSQYSIHFSKRRQYVKEQQLQRDLEVQLDKANMGESFNGKPMENMNSRPDPINQSDSDDDDKFYSKKKVLQNIQSPERSPVRSPVRSAPVVKDYPESLRQTEGENFVEAKLITPIMDDNDSNQHQNKPQNPFGSQTNIKTNKMDFKKPVQDSSTEDSDDGYPSSGNKRKPIPLKQKGSEYQRHESPRYDDGWGFGKDKTKLDQRKYLDDDSGNDSRGHSPRFIENGRPGTETRPVETNQMSGRNTSFSKSGDQTPNYNQKQNDQNFGYANDPTRILTTAINIAK